MLVIDPDNVILLTNQFLKIQLEISYKFFQFLERSKSIINTGY